MKSGALIFLGSFLALATSWFGLVFVPHSQIGTQTPDKADQLAALESRTNWLAVQHGLAEKTGGSGAFYPSARPGLAQLGAEIYRANGCASCHTRQVRQMGTAFELQLVEVGTNKAEVVKEFVKLEKVEAFDELGKPKSDFPNLVAELEVRSMARIGNLTKEKADAAQKALTKAGAKAEVVVVPLGADISRGWGIRQTVAQDYLYDNPVMLGSQRVGPDLANVGARRDADWQLRHLYNPRIEVKNSTMPPFRFLFEQRKIRGDAPSQDALKVDSALAGFEIVPTKEAKALVAYLVSLRADAPLFETPMTAPKTSNTSTNAPAQ